MPQVYGVFEGGGVRGSALVGAVAAADEHGISYRGLAGASAGAIVASLLAAGYTSEEMHLILGEKNFRDFKDKVSLVEKFMFWKAMGIYKGEAFHKWIGEKISIKVTGKVHSSPSFSQLPIPLTIVATDLVRQEVKVFSNKRTPDMVVADAVRMSMSIPFVFKPVRQLGELIVDGGMISNFPAWAFDEDRRDCHLPILGFRLQPDDAPQKQVTNAASLAYALVFTMMKANISLQINHLNDLHIVELPTLGVHTTDFNISTEVKEQLYNSGYHTMKAALATSEILNSS
jgi:NTE family protein